MLRYLYGTVFIKIFPLWERLGFHITPNSFYQPIPDTRTLKDKLWMRQSELVGIDMNEQEQIQLLNCFLRFKGEYDAFPTNVTSKPWQYYLNNPNFGPVDAEVLYCMIRHLTSDLIKESLSISMTYSSHLSIPKIGC